MLESARKRKTTYSVESLIFLKNMRGKVF